ncbi:Inner nuclear membrane protein SRC1 [Pseudozyma hubeiensis]|nr:Inner nuclear membrane protein SRC1 [Pseudozyma hubeiensis]
MVERDEYLREGFDPHTLTMPQLRSILVEHDVPFSSAARKADLVDHFTDNVLPKLSSLRKKNASVVASSSGIIDMREQSTPDQTPAKRKPGRPRKSEAPTPSASTPKTPAKTPAKGRTPARKKSSLAKELVSSAESEAEPDTKDVKSEPEEAEVPVKRKTGRPRKTAPAVVSAPAEASEPEDNTSPRRVSFDPKTSPPASASRKVGRLSLGARSDDDGTFSDSNPFQSGSEASPATGPAAKAAASARKARRKTTDGSSLLRKKTSASSLASGSPPKPKQAQKPSPSVSSTLRNYMDQAVAATTPPRIIGRLTGTTSANSTGGHAADDEGTVRHARPTSPDAADDADEDDLDLETFTSPSALAKMRHLRRKRDQQRRREQRSGKSFVDYLLNSALTIAAVSVLAWTVWYAKETRALGFCDAGSDTNSIVEDRRLTARAFAQANNETLEDLNVLPDRLQPACTPCPPHANCAYGKVLGCTSDDWVLQPNTLSHVPLADWVLPLSMTAPSCYPDTQKLVLASELAQAISHMLAEFKGEIVCGTQKTHATVRRLPKKVVSSEGNLTYAIAEAAVKRSMSATRDTRVDEEYFEQIWYMALFELTDPRSNVVRIGVENGTVGEGVGGEGVWYLAAKEAKLSMSCATRLMVKGWVLRARLYFGLVVAGLVGFWYARYRLAAARAESGKVAVLVQAALEKLQLQEYLHGRDPVLHPDDFIPLSHLRDDILREEHHATTRNRLWKKVTKVVEENSNVRTRQAQKKGEWLRVWQWVGMDGYRAGAGEVAADESLPVA